MLKSNSSAVSELEGQVPAGITHETSPNSYHDGFSVGLELHNKCDEFKKGKVTLMPKDFPGILEYQPRRHRLNRVPAVDIMDKELASKHEIVGRKFRFFTYESYNISWWVAWIFTFGSILWVINGFVLMFPFESDEANRLVGPLTAFFGAFVFLIGAYFGVLEAVNASRTLEFGYEVEELAGKTLIHLRPHRDYRKSLKWEKEPYNWKWHSCKWNTYGQKSAQIQFFGAILFMVSSTLFLPNPDLKKGYLIPNDNWILQIAFIWIFQILGSLCFMIGSLILRYEIGFDEYKELGWHVNFWNFLGGLGFLLCALFGPAGNVDGENACCQYYGTLLSTTWGSVAFLIGSILLVAEVANKH